MNSYILKNYKIHEGCKCQLLGYNYSIITNIIISEIRLKNINLFLISFKNNIYTLIIYIIVIF